MADIRINALATTATSSASDDYVAIDGAANGTRKLSAYSPTFGGNVTASGGELKAQGFGGSLTKGVLTLNYAGNTYLYNDGSALRLAIGGSDGLVINSSLNSTLAGNLTVSGTGTSSFAGNLLVTNSKFSFWDTGDQATNGYLEAGHFSNGSFIGTVAGTNAVADLVRFGTSGTERMRLNSSGNLLIAATVDSGNGKLQLATHTTSAGGIGFGTDISLYRSASNRLFSNAALTINSNNSGAAINSTFQLNGGGASGANNILDDILWNAQGLGWLRIYGTRDSGGGYGATQFFQTMNGSGTLTTALTLDSSQNATFAKTVTAQSSDNATAGVVVKSGDQVAIANWICDSTASSSIRNWSITTNGSSYGDLEFRSSNARGGNPVSAGTKVFSINSSGAISIGNTVTAAASVASTHKVTISIGGVTYYLLASNV